MFLLVVVPFVFSQGVQLKGSNTVDSAPNNPTTGTMRDRLAKIVAGQAVLATTADTDIALYPVSTANATTGDAIYVTSGPSVCEMDSTIASGASNWPVVASVLVGGRCHAQAALPSSGYVLGYMKDDVTTLGQGANYIVALAPNHPATGSGAGSVVNVAQTVPPEFSVTGSPITTSGTLAITKVTQAANLGWFGPASGAAAQPTFRAPVAADIAAALAGTTLGGSLGGSLPNPTVVNAPGGFSFSGDIHPTTLAGNADNYTPTNGALTTVWYLDGGTVDRTISGLYAGVDGEIKVIVNYGATNALLLTNQSTGSSATGRFLFGGDVFLAPGESQAIIYDASTSGVLAPRWKPLGAVMLEALRLKSCQFGVGSPSTSAAPIAGDDAVNNACANDVGRDQEVLTVSCMANNTGVVINPILTGGSSTSILTAPLTCGNAVWTDGTVQTTRPIVHSFSGTGSVCTVPSCSLNTSWTTTGLATELLVRVKTRMR